MLIDFALFGFGTSALYLAVDKFGIGEKLISLCSRNKELDEYMLQVGYSGILRKQIIVNFRTTPHLLVCGLSGQGKSKMVESAIKFKKNVILLNVFEDDFTSIKSRRINEVGEILIFLKALLEDKKKYDEPIYVVIDELLTLSMNKKVNTAISELLAVGRHYNIFVIGICQRGEKTELSYKNLFNARICFRQVEESSYRAVLGYSPVNKTLNHREFYIYSDVIEKGKTYDL